VVAVRVRQARARRVQLPWHCVTRRPTLDPHRHPEAEGVEDAAEGVQARIAAGREGSMEHLTIETGRLGQRRDAAERASATWRSASLNASSLPAASASSR
jgi:hypothetical protein